MNRKIKLTLTVLVMGLMLLLASAAFARGPENAGQKLIYKTSDVLDPNRTLINANNWSYWMYYDGGSGIDPEGNAGGVYPRGTAGTIFEDGFVWGAKIGDKIKVGGQTYRVGTKQMLDRIYRIRSDWKKLKEDPKPIRQDAAEFFRVPNDQVTEQQMADIVAQYEKDWNEWPVDEGAPYYDVDGNGEYNPDGGDYPGIANADQVVWTKVNDSDSSRCIDLYGSSSIGMELEITAWAYNQTESQLGQVIFKKYKLTNTSSDTLKDMYVAQWCDPDVGNYTDDVVGCDPALGMGFAYNGGETDDDFADLGLAPSAVGFDFFQGPIVDGVAGQDINNNGVDDAEDYAVFDLKKVGPGKVNMQMTSFGYFSAGNNEWDDPDLGVYDGTLQWYNLLRGYITNTDVESPTPFTHRATGVETKFPLDGDPVTGSGDIDGNPGLGNFAPADRRMSLSTGPFEMKPGDVQEVVVAIVGGKSGSLEKGSRTQSVFDLKVNDEIAQFLYNTLFTQVPKPPTAPFVEISPLETKIAISWGNKPEIVKETENTVEAGYAFEGYNVYQLPTVNSGLDDAVRVATFDVKNDIKKIIETRFLPEYGQGVKIPVRFGTDSGIQRYFVIDKDYLTGEPLHPGNTYYFAVTAYNYNPNAEVVKSLESSLTVLPVTTQSAKPGVKYEGEPGENLEVAHSTGISDGSVSIIVVDPTVTTGDDYKVNFYTDADTNSATYGTVVWDLTDTDAGTTVLSKKVQLAPGAPALDAPIVDGLQVKVYGPPAGINPYKYGDFYSTNYGPDYRNYDLAYLSGWDFDGGRWISGTDWGGLALFGGMDNGYNFFGSEITDGAMFHDVELRFAGGDSAAFPDRWSKGAVYHRDKGYAFQGIGDIPISAWDTEDNRRLNLCFVEMDGIEAANNDTVTVSANMVWDMAWHEVPADTGFGKLGGREYLFIMNSDYNGGADYDNSNWGPAADVLYAIWPASRGSHPFLEAPFEIQVLASNVNLTEDEFEFTAPKVEESLNLEKEAAKKVTVYPNPYYADNPRANNQFDKYITFYHLPKKATIRIFDLAGNHVTKLEKDDNTQFLNWNLENASGLPVGSGIYFAHVEMVLSDGSKVTKVLKVFVIQRAQIIKYY